MAHLPDSRPGPDTRESLLEAAERLFAEHGIARTSLRAITRAAEANLASVHYHFGSKEELVRALFARRLGPLNRERLALLARCQETAAGAPELSCILHAHVAPALRMMRDPDPGGRCFAKLMARSFAEPDEKIRSVLLAEFREVVERFTDALARALPQLPREELYWRFHFSVGAMAHTAGGGVFVRALSGGLCDPEEVEANIRRLVTFLVGGWSSPAAPTEEEQEERGESG